MTTNSPHAPSQPAELSRDVLDQALSRGSFDRQFAAIVTLVATFQVSLVAYASRQPSSTSLDPPSSGRWQLVRDLAPPPLSPPPRAEIAPAPPLNRGAAPSVARGARARALESRGRGGMLEVLGARGRRGGALDDLFEEGGLREKLDSAFARVRGVQVARASGATRGDGSVSGLELGALGTGPAEAIALGGKDEAALELAGEGEALGTVKPDGISVEGEVLEVLRGQLGGIRACYESALKRDRALSGKLVLEFEIDGRGRARGVSFDGDTLSSAAVNACLLRRASAWRFPIPADGSMSVRYPLVFTPASF